MMVRLLLLVLLLMLVESPSQAVTFSVDSTTKIKKINSPEETLSAGNSFEIKKNESVLVMPEESLPVLIVSPGNDQSILALSSIDLKSLTDNYFAKTLNQQTNEIISGLRKAEVAMGQRDYVLANSVLVPLKQKYPFVASLYFMIASIDYLLKNKTSAIDNLQKGLALDPQDLQAKKLLTDLTGGKQ